MVLKQNAGIDVSMDSFDVNLSILDDNFEKLCNGTRKFTNNPKGYQQLVEWVDKRKVNEISLSFTMEFTGVYYEQLAYFLKSSGGLIYMVIPSKAKRYCESLSKSSKTDKLDAQALSWMGLERKLREWEPHSLMFLDLRALTREREELLKERTVIQNRYHAASTKAIGQVKTIHRYKERLTIISKQIDEIEKEIMELIKEDSIVYQKFKNIITIPGVAFVTAATLIAETNGFSAILNIKQLTSYAGLDVRQKQSGKYEGRAKISKQGNAHIRRVLHFPAQAAIIHNEPLSIFYERVNARKDKPMIAAVGVQRKLLGLVYTLWKNDTQFDPYYQAKAYVA